MQNREATSCKKIQWNANEWTSVSKIILLSKFLNLHPKRQQIEQKNLLSAILAPEGHGIWVVMAVGQYPVWSPGIRCFIFRLVCSSKIFRSDILRINYARRLVKSVDLGHVDQFEGCDLRAMPVCHQVWMKVWK